MDCYEINKCNELTINKKQINIVLPYANYVYDGLEHYVGLDYSQFTGNNAICGNDYLYDNGFNMTNPGDYTYYKDNVYCTNSSNYIFVFDQDAKTSTIQKRKISINFQDLVETYNGKNQKIKFSIAEGSLAYGDSFISSINEGSYYTSDELLVKTKGTYKKSDFKGFFNADGKPIIRNAQGIDVTNNYDIVEDFDTTNIEVKPYKLDVTFALNNPPTYTYDGTTKVFNNLTFSNPIIQGHSYEIINAYSAKHAGEYTNDNKSYLKIYDEFGDDVSFNYQFTYNYWNKVTINKADLSIKINDFTPTYDGRSFSAHYQSNDNKFEIVSGSLYEGSSIKCSIKAKSDSIFIDSTNFADLVDISIINSTYANAANDYNLSIQYGSCSYLKRDLYFEGANTSHTYSKQQPTTVKINSVGDQEFYSRHTLTRDPGAVTTNGIYVGKYDLSYDLSKWHLINKNAGNVEVNNYVNFIISNTSQKVSITQRKVTITEKGDSFIEGEKTQANEIFMISNLLEGDHVFLEVPNYEKEEVIPLTKTDYKCIINMSTKTPKGEQFRYDNGTKAQSINSTNFKIYTKINGVDVDITKSYLIELKKENTKYLNPIYIK